uniref:Uncharacterized protein n=1 Tax=Setaria italica TaxID=4555 RepID=K3Z1X8_SETIT
MSQDLENTDYFCTDCKSKYKPVVDRLPVCYFYKNIYIQLIATLVQNNKSFIANILSILRCDVFQVYELN